MVLSGGPLPALLPPFRSIPLPAASDCMFCCVYCLPCRYESLGNDGMGSMYRWFEAYQDEHFPDPMGLRAMAHKCVFLGGGERLLGSSQLPSREDGRLLRSPVARVLQRSGLSGPIVTSCPL